MTKETPKSGKPSLAIAVSPALVPHYQVEGKIVVVIDILRATSSICVAFAHGAKRILPVLTPDEAISFRIAKYLVAGERDGKKIDGFDMGNSPFDFMENVQGKEIVMTTTNGTQAIIASRFGKKIIIGSFLNLGILTTWLSQQKEDVLLLCSGWKNKLNLEDFLFAGVLADRLIDTHNLEEDSVITARHLVKIANGDYLGFIKNAAHAQRFERLGIEKDMAYCLQEGIIDIIPELKGDYLVPMKLP